MATLRSNVVFSTLAFALVGILRPGFNALVNHVFGPTVNGQAATVLALVYLAAMPATAGLPTVAVRHVSRALGEGKVELSRAYARTASGAALAFALIGSAIAIGSGLVRAEQRLTGLEIAFVLLGVFAYCYWQLFRSLFLAAGRAALSLRADLLSAVVVAVSLGAVIALDRPELVVGAFLTAYAAYMITTLPYSRALIAGGRLDPEARRSFWRYAVLWLIASATALATRELSLLVLAARAEDAVVGELSVALSLLSVLALAPRVIEIPLIHQLSQLSGEGRGEERRQLTERALDWLGVLVFAAGVGAAILAGPILSIVGDVHTPAIAAAFVIIAFAFMSELILTPASNLLIAEAPPWVMTLVGTSSLIGAVAFWASPIGQGLEGLVLGLALSYAIRAVMIGGYARSRFHLVLFRRPLAKAIALAAGVGLAVLALRGSIDAYLAFAIFEAGMLALFVRDLRDMATALLGARAKRAEG